MNLKFTCLEGNVVCQRVNEDKVSCNKISVKTVIKNKQGRIHGQLVVACGWAGAVMWLDRGSVLVGGGCNVAGQER